MAAPLKDGLGRLAVKRLAANIARVWPDFDAAGFVAAAMRGLSQMELKERVAHVARVLSKRLPQDYPEAVAIIVAAARDWDRGDPDDPLRGFAAWPLFDVIESRGIDDFERSMAALRAITHLFSAEFAIRSFIARYREAAFTELERWTKDDSEHVRRLVSEGTRPRLPWASRIDGLIEDPSAVIPLLELLKDDSALYVRRSVANNLNDIAKDHPELVIDLCQQWLKQPTDERRWLVKHATRTLVKRGHPRVWSLLGFTKRPKVEVSELELSAPQVRMGQSISFDVSLTSTARSKQRLVVDYAVHFVKANGEQRPKVFKLKEVNLAKGATEPLSARISFKKISTRVYYAGEHRVELLVNGTARAEGSFELT